MPTLTATPTHTPTAIPALLRRGGCLLMLAAAVAAPFLGVRFGGLDPCDESYQALCAGSYASQPAAPAVFAAGYAWQALFGHDALTLRYLGVLCVLASLAVGALWHYRQHGNLTQACALLLAASLAATPAVFRIYNWDTGAYPAQALALTAALSLWLRPRIWKAALLGALCAWVFLCRVQLIVYLPLALWLAAAAMPRGRWRAAATVAAAFVAAWLAGSLLIFGEAGGHVGAILSGNFISGHSPADWRRIAHRAILDALDLPLAWLPQAAAFAAATVFRHYAPPQGWRKPLLAAMLCGWILLAAAATATFYDGIIFAADIPLFLALALLPRALRSPAIPRGAIWICVISVALTAFGSDAIAERYFAAFALAPLAAVIQPSLNRRGLRLLWSIVAFSAFAGGCTALFRYRLMAEEYTQPMDRFTLQEGLLGSRRDMMYWGSLDHEMNMRINKRIKFVCRPYGLLLSYGPTPHKQPEFQNFHFYDGDAAPEYDSAGHPLYDAYIFTLATPENMPLTIRRFADAGYTLAPRSEASANGEYFILESTK